MNNGSSKKLLWLLALLVILARPTSGQTFLLERAIVHTVSGETLTNGSVLIQDGKIAGVFADADPSRTQLPADTAAIDLQGQHLYPGLIVLDSALGLSEIDAVRATQDTTEVGDYTPDVESWIAVNPDSELIPVARANGIAYFEPVPQGKIVSGQSALLAMSGWTYEDMMIKKPIALHIFWPRMELSVTPKGKTRDATKWKSLDDQAKERRARLRSVAEFFEEAKAYSKAKAAGASGDASALEMIPAWEAMLPYVRGELPLMIHAEEIRQIKSAVNWATTNQFLIILAGGRDAWMLADLLATNHIPVIYDATFTQPTRDTESYDAPFTAPEILRKAGVKVAFSMGLGGFSTTSERNLPYAAAQAIAFGLPEAEALKGLTIYPAELSGVADRLGSIEVGKEATLFVCDGNIFDIRANVKRMWIAGKEVSLENRQTRLYEKYKDRPKF